MVVLVPRVYRADVLESRVENPMASKQHRAVSDADWNQLMTLAAGYLVLEDGDVKAAMARAIAAHTELIRALKAETIQADIASGTVTMFVPDEGGVALRLEKGRGFEDEPTTPIDAPAPPTTTATGSSTFYMDEDDA